METLLYRKKTLKNRAKDEKGKEKKIKFVDFF